MPALQRLDIRPLPSSADAAVGYVVVVVDGSSSAPHMVTVSGESRYYGRTPSGNAPLAEAQVAALYARRAKADQDAMAVLQQAVAGVLFDRNQAVMRLDAVVWPAHADRALGARAVGARGAAAIAELVHQARNIEVPAGSAALNPEFESPYLWNQSMTGWVARRVLVDTDMTTVASLPRGMYGDQFQEIMIDDDGTLHVAWGGAGENVRNGALVVHSVRVAEYVRRTVWLGGQLLKRGGYLGQTVCMIRLGPMLGAIDSWVEEAPQFPIKYKSRVTWYERSVASSALALADNPRDIARDLVAPLLRELTQGKIDPFA